MRLAALVAVLLVACSSSDTDDDDGDACNPPDEDGIIGGAFSLEVSISDTDFSPKVVQVQNSANVTLTVRNTGTKVHSFEVGCRNVPGCTLCFPGEAKVSVEPGASRTVAFTAPSLEGIYPVTSTGDAFVGQFSLN